ncbi:hypothetical protein PAL_GLEAN10017070 [Pteropus alecto]|uniref:Uncharacterized protein n=1 Tax=Pteropus alecto TaxID=9402 RepID=L5KHK8_PTEAL|nr:hypothetical protein PAL_GLEAN10017070 [Pteropus alecto]
MWWNLWPFLKSRLLQPADVSPRISLYSWTGLVIPLGVRIPSNSFMEWSNEDDFKEFVCGIFTNRPECFIRPSGAGGALERRELSVLPAAHPEKKAHGISLLLPL